MEKSDQDELILLSIILMLAVFGGCLIGESKTHYNTVENTNNNIVGSPQKELDYNNLIDLCRNESMKVSADCVMGQLQPLKKYRIVNDSINLTFEELISTGGDCNDWSKLMTKIGGDYNITARNLLFPARYNEVHAISRWSNHKGYCIFDVYTYMCITYEN